MNIVAIFDIIGLIFVTGAIALVLVSRMHERRPVPFAILLGLLSLELFNFSSNTLEWTGITSRFDEFEDFIAVVQPVMWLFFLHSFLDARITHDLKQTLQEKEVLFKEVHHRVKNNLLTLYSLVSLQQTAVEDQKMVSGALQDTKQRIQAMGKVHQMLYDSANLAKIDFAAYIKSFVEETKITYGAQKKDIDISLDLEPVVLYIETAIPSALIVNEILVNAFKHAFPDRDTGRIDISLKRHENKVELKIRDNGIGIPEDILSQRQKTLGLRLIDMLSHQLNGNVSCTRENGSVFSVTFQNAPVAG